MPLVPTGFVSQAELDAEVHRAISQLGADVVRVRYGIGQDSGGDAALYFRIVLADRVVRPREMLRDTTQRISSALMDDLYPYSRWGLIPYFNFRSESEQATRHEPEWS